MPESYIYLGNPPWVRGDPQAFVFMYTETYLPILLLFPSSTTIDLLQYPLVQTSSGSVVTQPPSPDRSSQDRQAPARQDPRSEPRPRPDLSAEAAKHVQVLAAHPGRDRRALESAPPRNEAAKHPQGPRRPEIPAKTKTGPPSRGAPQGACLPSRGAPQGARLSSRGASARCSPSQPRSIAKCSPFPPRRIRKVLAF